MGLIERASRSASDRGDLRSAGVSAPISSPKRRARGGTHLIDIEDLALDLTRFQDLLGQCAEDSLLTEPEAQAFHPAKGRPPVTDGGKLRCQPFLIPVEPGPIVSFVNAHGYSPHNLRTERRSPQDQQILSVKRSREWPVILREDGMGIERFRRLSGLGGS